MNTISVAQPDVEAKQCYASAPDALPTARRVVTPIAIPATTTWQVVETLQGLTAVGAASGAKPMSHWTQTRVADNLWQISRLGPFIDLPRPAVDGSTTAAVDRAAGRAKAIQTGLAACVALETCGLLLASYANAAGAGTLIAGFALVLLWSGLAALTVTVHREGKRSGEYLLAERWSYPVAAFSVGMVIVAIVGTVEFSFFR